MYKSFRAKGLLIGLTIWLSIVGVIATIYSDMLSRYDFVVSPSVPMGLYEKIAQTVVVGSVAKIDLSVEQYNKIAREIPDFKIQSLMKPVFAVAGQTVCFDGQMLINKTTQIKRDAKVDDIVSKHFDQKTGCYEIPNNYVFALSLTPRAIDSRVLGEVKLFDSQSRVLVYAFGEKLGKWMYFSTPTLIDILIIFSLKSFDFVV
jgi:type IV secretory pathway protease TraF